MARIILIDDDHGPMGFYLKALRQSGFDVEHIDSVAGALDHIEHGEVPGDLYVLDLMMPPGDAMELEKAGFGLKSGIELYRSLRARWENVPVIILTSISNPAILELLPVDSNTLREAKIDLLPFELVEKVKQRLEYGGS